MVNDNQIEVYGGIDTHADTHHVAVIDAAGRRLADVQVPTTAAGYQAALRFLGSWPTLASVGIECTGSYGAAVTRAVREAGIGVFAVNRPNRFDRHRRGKTDVFDAYSAAEAVVSGRATAAPKGGDGLVEALALALAHDAGLTHCPCSLACKHHPGRTCGVRLDYETTRVPNSAEPDHITPHAHCGPDTVENMSRIVCRRCNQARGDKPLHAPTVAPVTRATSTTRLVAW
ncbi:IS110 family transposase [Demequina lutea]|uniref:Transposase n=1 Tax=Demequina lutea TaxID=431489 RepID=A0A7Y9ZBB4_9MICO|nr:IS110 family transposase [Demequina lutea]NYI42036.1 hypothetical protein [Demequina lutea]